MMYFAIPTTAAVPENRKQASFAVFDQRAKKGECLNVVFFGGSLTWGAQASDPQLTSYRALISRKLESAYPNAHFRFWDGAIGGTGSQLGAIRLDRDVLSRDPDLVFLDFTANDGPYGTPDPDKLASYEAIVHRLISSGVPIVQVIFPIKKDVTPNPPLRPLDEEHRRIASAYHLPSADVVTSVRLYVASGKAKADDLWSIPLDDVHPGDAGYALYADAVWSSFEQAVVEGFVCMLPPKMLHAETYLSVQRKRLTTLGNLPSGWMKGLPNRTAITFDFLPSRWLDDEVVATREREVAPEPLRISVQAEAVMLFGEVTPSSGKYEVRIDGGEPKTYDSANLGKNGNLRYFQMIAQGLDSSRVHRIEITPLLEAGQELRLESICLAGSSAQVLDP